MAPADQYVATEPLFIGRARAANPGDVVPAEHVEKYGWEDGVTQVQAPTPAAADPTVEEILAGVGNDKDAAATALAVENDRARPRVTLVKALESVITA